MAYDEVMDQVWIASDKGITRYLSSSSSLSKLPPPGEVLGIKSYKDSVMVADNRGGIWIGLNNGLFYSDAHGKWTNTGIKTAVTALLLDAQNILWIGSKGGITWVDDKQAATLISNAEGCEFSDVMSLAEYGSGVLVVAEGKTAGDPARSCAPCGCDLRAGNKRAL
jgi:ligand-binding sensor domain-containing protein